MTTSVKRSCIIGGVSLLAVVAVMGWSKKAGPAGATAYPASLSTPASDQAAYPPGPPAITPANPTASPTPAYYASEAAATSPEPRSHVVVKKRPMKNSVAIVGGSAAGGAAIGALAGGGKGAAIGALAGGAGGFIYDRLTHKKKQVVQY
jgi:hypothetical protein